MRKAKVYVRKKYLLGKDPERRNILFTQVAASNPPSYNLLHICDNLARLPYVLN